MSYSSNEQAQNDAKKAINVARSSREGVKRVLKSSSKHASRSLAVLPLPVKIGLICFFGIVLISSILPAGTGGIYSNENTHVYSNAKDPNYPTLYQMNAKDIATDNTSKDKAVNKMSEYIETIHEIIESEKDDDIKPAIDAKISSEGWDSDETYAQINDETDFSSGTSINGSSISESATASSSTSGESLVAYARKFIGPDYVWGGNKLKSLSKKGDKNAIDCSGFTKEIFKRKANVTLSRSAKLQRYNGKIIGHGNSGLKKALPGDLLIYYGDSSDHVGIYSGKKNGKHYQVHSSVGWGKRGVMETPLSRTPKDIVRVLKEDKVASASKSGAKESIGEKAADIAKRRVGSKVNYSQGSLKWSKTDCGGFVYLVYKEAGKSIPHNTKKLKKYGKNVGTNISKAKPGDIIVYGVPYLEKNGYAHVAIYAGNGKRIEVTSSSPTVRKISVKSKFPIRSIRRVEGEVLSSAASAKSVTTAPKSAGNFSTKVKKTIKVPDKDAKGRKIRICGGSDFTANYGTRGWAWSQKKVHELWKKKGSKGSKNVATINGYYLIATRSVFGKVGDAVSIYLKDGTKFNAIIADEKGRDAESECGLKGKNCWGHLKGSTVSPIEWESLSYSVKVDSWVGKAIVKVENYGKYNGVDINSGEESWEDSSSEITVEDLKVLSAYSVSINNLQIYEMKGKVKRVASSAGYRMSGNKTYSLVDNDGKKINVKTDKYGRIDFAGDMEAKMKKYAKKRHKEGKTAFYDVSFQTDSSGSTTYIKHIKIDTGLTDENDEPIYIEYDLRYGVPIIKNKDISKICMPMFGIKPKEKYANGKSITNSEAIIELTKNAIAIYLDGDPDSVDGLKSTVNESLQSKYSWPAPGHEKKKDYSYNKKNKTLTIKGKKGDPVVSIAGGTVSSIVSQGNNKKDTLNVISADDLGINNENQGVYKDITPKTVIISHEKGAVKSIYKNVIIIGGLKKGLKVNKGDTIGNFAGNKIAVQIKHNGKLVNPLEFLKQDTFNGKFVWPLPKGYTSISSPWGYRICPFHGRELHSGADIPAPTGTTIKAAAAGTVKSAGNAGSYGNRVIIEHSSGKKGVATWYCHMSKILVKNGEKVRQGQVIGRVGSTGDSTGAHLHLGYYVNGVSKNPLKYIKKP